MESYGESKTALPTSDGLHQTAHVCSVSDVIQGKASTAIVNASFEEEEEDKGSYNYGKSHLEYKKNNELTLDVAELENHLWRALSEHNDNEQDNYKTDEVDSVESSGYEGDSSLDGTDVESIELCMPETFIDMVPNYSALILSSRRGSSRVSPLPSPRLSRSASKRIPRSSLFSERVHIHPHSTGIDYGVHRNVRSRLNSETQESPFPTPRLTRSALNRHSVSPLAASEEPQKFFATGIDPKIRSRLNSETQESPFPSPTRSRSPSDIFSAFKELQVNYPNGIDPNIQSRLDSEIQASPLPSPQLSHSALALELSNSNSLKIDDNTLKEVHLNSVAINDGEMEKEISKANDIDSELTIIDRSKSKSTRTKSWKTLFKNPVFYKVRKWIV